MSKFGKCSVEGCPRNACRSGLCRSHGHEVLRIMRDSDPRYCRIPGCGRWKRQGDLCGMHKALELVQSAISSATDECIEWSLGCTKQGYGCFYHPDTNKQHQAHSYVCREAHGPRPQGHYACHSCDNRKCYNPRHISWGTPTKNNREAYERKRAHRGSQRSNALLTEEIVVAIRLSTEATRTLAARYGVDESLLGLARTGKAWKHVNVKPPLRVGNNHNSSLWIVMEGRDDEPPAISPSL